MYSSREDKHVLSVSNEGILCDRDDETNIQCSNAEQLSKERVKPKGSEVNEQNSREPIRPAESDCCGSGCTPHENSEQFPCEPIRPAESDCCGSGCTPHENSEQFPCEPIRPAESDCCGSGCTPHENSEQFPCEPIRPADSDCCGSGCTPCVFDIYDQEIKIWEKECERIRNKLSPDNQSTELLLLKEEYRGFVIESVTMETANTKRFRISLPKGRSLGLHIGEHVILRGQYHGQTITRQYTPVSDIHSKGYFELLIKIYQDGKMSQYVRTWIPGSVIELRGPYGSLDYHPNKHRCLWMLAAGTGIAPMAQVIQAVLSNEEEDTVMRLYYACRTYKDVLMKTEIQEWRKYWNFSVIFILSQETSNTESSFGYGEVIHRGHLNEDYLASEWKHSACTAYDLVLICGTASFDSDMKKQTQKALRNSIAIMPLEMSYNYITLMRTGKPQELPFGP